MQNAKNKVMESLPNLIKTTKQKVQIVANWFFNWIFFYGITNNKSHNENKVHIKFVTFLFENCLFKITSFSFDSFHQSILCCYINIMHHCHNLIEPFWLHFVQQQLRIFPILDKTFRELIFDKVNNSSELSFL